MKGDGNIKKYKIKFLNVGYKNKYQVNIKVYDVNNKLIYKGTTYNGEVIISLKRNSLYKLEANFLNEKICKSFYTSNNKKIFKLSLFF